MAGAIRRAAVPREELFLVTKIWFDDMGERTTEALQESLKLDLNNEISIDFMKFLVLFFWVKIELMVFW